MKERLRASLLFLYRVLDLSALSVALWLAFYYGGRIGMDYVVVAATLRRLTAYSSLAVFLQAGSLCFRRFGSIVQSDWRVSKTNLRT